MSKSCDKLVDDIDETSNCTLKDEISDESKDFKKVEEIERNEYITW